MIIVQNNLEICAIYILNGHNIHKHEMNKHKFHKTQGEKEAYQSVFITEREATH